MIAWLLLKACRGGKTIFPQPSRFLAETHKQQFNKMYTSCIHGRYPRKLGNSLKLPSVKSKSYFHGPLVTPETEHWGGPFD